PPRKNMELVAPFLAERSRPMVFAVRDLIAAAEELADALDAKFGKVPANQVDPVRQVLDPDPSQLVKGEMTAKKELGKDRVVVTVLSMSVSENKASKPPTKVETYKEQQFLLVKEGDNWRRVLRSPFENMEE